MKTWNGCFIGLLGLFGVSGCDVVFGMVPGQLDPIRPVSGDLTKDTTWTPDQTTMLEGVVRVKPGATLTIEAGTRILAAKGAALFVHRGARIVAHGTREKPIVFTSAATSRTAGDWHGLYLCGRAPINGAPDGDFKFETPFNTDANGQIPPDDICGGDLTEDSSGELHFVRIEFAGADDGMGLSSSGIEMAGIGSGTIIDHLQVHHGGGDAISIYGGAVQLKYVLVTRTKEDVIDWAFGWRGKAQFVAGFGEDDGFEGGSGTVDSYEDNPSGKTPSNATIYNATIVGVPANDDTGLNLNSGMQGQFFNILVADYGTGASVDADEAKDNAIAGTLDVRNSIFSNEVNFDPRTFSDSWLAETWLMVDDPTRANRALDPGAHGIRSITPGAFDFSLMDGAPGLMGAAMPPDDGFFDTSAAFVGACAKTCPEFEGWTEQPVD